MMEIFFINICEALWEVIGLSKMTSVEGLHVFFECSGFIWRKTHGLAGRMKLLFCFKILRMLLKLDY